MAQMGRRSSEKTNFAVACSLLSQYIKEKGSAVDLGLGMAAQSREPAKVKSEAIWPPTTMSLLPGADVPSDERKTKGISHLGNAMELFPQQAGLGSAPAATGKIPEVIREQERGQLTIFYGGKVLVFNDFPSEKAKDLMQLASKGNLTTQNFGYVPPSSTAVDQANSSPNQDSNLVPGSVDASLAAAQGHLRKPTISTLPQPPKASLKRFLEERKHRIKAKAPYQVSKPLAIDSSVKPESWLGLAPQLSTPSHSINSDCRR